LIDAAAGKIDSDTALLSAKNTEPANEHLCEAFSTWARSYTPSARTNAP
jgi:hypothetical protein